MNWYGKLLARLRFRRADRTEEDDEMSFVAETELNYDRDPFLNSLKRLQPEDIRLATEPAVRTAAQKASDIVRSVFLYICIGVFLVSCVLLVDNFRQKQKGAELYDAAAAEFAAAGLDFGFGGVQQSDEGVVAHLRKNKSDAALISLSVRIRDNEMIEAEGKEPVSEYSEQLEKLRAVLRTYKERNDDVYGYISIPAAGIEYVVVQGDDNEYYLNHNYKGEYLVIGSIFADYRCDPMIMRNFNTVFYGHNINGGALFHNVTKFLDEEVFAEGLIYIYTMDGVYIYKPFSIYDTNASSGYIRTGFTSKEDFVSFSAEMKARSRIQSDLTVGEDDRIITLSTCTNLTADGRYALHAVLIDYIT